MAALLNFLPIAPAITEAMKGKANDAINTGSLCIGIMLHHLGSIHHYLMGPLMHFLRSIYVIGYYS
ncbi:hypothetical protein JCM16161A_14730 [Vulcanisaeta sp. JCM 16161]